MTSLSGLPVVWSEDCLRHEPAGEVWLGVWETGTEVPERASVLLAELTQAGVSVKDAMAHDTSALLAVHDPQLVEHLATIWEQWEAGGYERDYGRGRVVPYVFPTPGLLGDLPMRSPAATHGRVGRFCYDTMTLVGPGSWEAIKGAADAALTAAELVAAGAPIAAGPSHDQVGVRRIVLPQQRRHRRAVAARLRSRAGRCDRHRRASRQRDRGDLL
jgi:acetoin utilization deacetylase AcuC-like enzyme